jgi:hypothetical protein
VVSCSEPADPEFHFRAIDSSVLDQHRSLVDVSYPSYDAALRVPPFAVVLVDGMSSRELEVKIGMCARTRCTGPLEQETVYLSLNTFLPANIERHSCVGLDGSIDVGVDGTGSGDCK